MGYLVATKSFPLTDKSSGILKASGTPRTLRSMQNIRKVALHWMLD